MVIVKFKGGLGNQMFQYANYIALKYRYPDIRIEADISQYNLASIHNGLEIEKVFGIKLNVKKGRRINKITLPQRIFYAINSKISENLYKNKLTSYKYIVDENVFNKEMFSLNPKRNYYIDGFWGDEQYFVGVSDIVRRHFTFDDQTLSEENKKIKTDIQSQNSVSLHIRRGDYLSSGSNFVDLCSTDYYPTATKFISDSISDPVFYIFSDDSEWCRNNLLWLGKFKHFFVETNTGNESYRDMQLMSLCRHNIMANSTFSWWGAWLNRNDDKIVVCAQNIFYDKKLNDNVVAQFYNKSWKILFNS